MNQFLKKAFVLFVLFSSISVFAQKGNYDKEPSMPFQPMFSFGMAYHSFQGDIMGPSTNALLGNMGYRAGMRLNIFKNIDASLLFSNTSFFEKNDNASFESAIDGIGLHLGYTLFKQSRTSPYLTAGVQNLSFKTSNTTNDDIRTGYARESTIANSLGLGLRLNISERIDLDATFNYTIAMGDIDKSVEEAADKFMSASFTIHYDLFTPKPKEIPFDDSYYADVNFKEMEVEDEDGDLIADIDDYCPKTPIGVKVDKNGCPLDGDNDGIPDYIDQEKNTRRGAVVDEKGVQLTDEKYHSMYSDYEAASREYANFYNENEIKRENYKTIDAYLIAKANAFNKAYNEGKDFNNTVVRLQYKVKIGAFSDGVSANVINKYLSLNDLESISQDNGVVIYSVGSYNTLDDAEARKDELEAKGFKETSILVDNNGEVSNYVAPIPEPVIDEDEIVVVPISEETEEQVEKEDEVVVPTRKKRKKQKKEKVVVALSNETIYRIQIGTFKDPLSDAIFVGVENVVPIKEKNGWTTYITGSFTGYQNAVNSRNQMRARGFEDALIVTYKNGERISLDIAIQTEKESVQPEVVIEEEVVKPNVEFTVQILVTKPDVEFTVQVFVAKPNVKFTVQVVVTKKSLSAENLARMSKLGNIEKEAEGQEMYRYFVGTYSSLEDANIRLAEAKSVGYTDAFVFAKLEDERITLEQTRYADFLGTYSSLEDANTRLAEAKLAGHPDAFLVAKLDGKEITLEQTMYPDFVGTYSSLEDANTRLAEEKLAGHPNAFVVAKLDGEEITIEQAKELLK